MVQTIAFRAPAGMAEAIESYRAGRSLPRFSDAAREIMERGLASPVPAPELLAAAGELRTLRMDPVIILRDALAEIERDNAMQPKEAA